MLKLILLILLHLTTHAIGFEFKPIKTISVVRKEITPENDTQTDPFDNYEDPTPLTNDGYNQTSLLKLQFETEKYVKKYGPQLVLDSIVKKFNLPSPSNDNLLNNTNRFINFFNKIISKPSDNLKLDFSKERGYQKKNDSSSKSKLLENFDKNYQRDLPDLSDEIVKKDHHPMKVPMDTDNELIRQPIVPTRLAYFSQHKEEDDDNNNANKIHKHRKRATSRQRRLQRLTRRAMDIALNDMEQRNENLELQLTKKINHAQAVKLFTTKSPIPADSQTSTIMPTSSTTETIITSSTTPTRILSNGHLFSRGLPIRKLHPANLKKKIINIKRDFNEKMFQLLNEYNIDGFRVETFDYVVKVPADPKRTLFVPFKTFSDNERPHPKPSFLYSRAISNEPLRRVHRKKMLDADSQLNRII